MSNVPYNDAVEAFRITSAVAAACISADVAVGNPLDPLDPSDPLDISDISELLRCCCDSGGSDAGAAPGDVLAGEMPVLDAAEAVLSAYDVGFGALSAPARDALSAANLKDLALLLERRPPLSPPVLAAVFQLSVVVAKHAPPAALDASGCRLLVALLELLGGLPHAHADGDAPSVLRIARIAARNVMRRVGPRLFAAQSPAAALLPWIERHLLPLHAVSSAEARADLREDRRLALVLLDFMPHRDTEPGLGSGLGRGVQTQYLADAARVLLHSDAEMQEHEREQVRAFLARAHDGPRETDAAAEQRGQGSNSNSNSNSGRVAAEAAAAKAVCVPSADARDFLLARDEGYARECVRMRERIAVERGTAAALERQLAELTRERDERMGELQRSAQAAGGVGGPHSGWTEEVLSLVQRVEELTVARHEKSMEQK